MSTRREQAKRPQLPQFGLEQLTLSLWLTDALAAERAATEQHALAPTSSANPKPTASEQPTRRTSHRGLPQFDPALATCLCPGCSSMPARTCAVCERPAVLAVVLEDSDHSCSYCRVHWELLQSVRSRKAPPLVTVPVRQGRARRRYALSITGVTDTARPVDVDVMPLTTAMHGELLVVAIA